MEYFDMEYRVLDITVISAGGLKNVNVMSDMDVYVVASISGDRRTERRTLTSDRGGGSCPEWNHRMKFSVAEDDVATPSEHFVRFDLRSKRNILGDRDIGYVSIRLHELLEKLKKAGGGAGGGERVAEHKVFDTTGKSTDGRLKFSYRFDEVFSAPPPQRFNEPGKPCAAPPGVAPPHLPAKVYLFSAETDAIKYGVEQMQKKNKHFLCLGLSR
ncbi:protein SRC2-like [Cornus florida]|uniref:protein SRC2-like n=1 Tax=Cornus florida TaxID=4283 RepID=UPI002896ABBD|nr:protein SRC2-like [Cornus florida]